MDYKTSGVDVNEGNKAVAAKAASNEEKIESELNWSPKIKFEEGIEDTIIWYLNNSDWYKRIINKSFNN